MANGSLTCPNCQARLPETARFCTECGKEIPKLKAIKTIGQLKTDPIGQKNNKPAASGVAGATLAAGDVVGGKFEIQDLIGEGGMGAVYRAVDNVTGDTAAVKIIAPGRDISDAEKQRLISEGKTTRRINHPNIVQIFDIGLHGDAPYVAMELIDGTPLHEWRFQMDAAQKTVPMKTAAKIIEEILKGLVAAHQAGIIHRDLKPENIMLIGTPNEEQANVKIVDFGIALALEDVPSSASGTGMGTQHYMAPEQIRSADTATATADLYAVSKIFYELIVGVIPTGHWQPPSGGRSDVPKGIDTLIQKGLSDNRNMRPQSAEEYLSQLESAMSSTTNLWQWGEKSDPDTRKQELKEAQSDLKAAYIRAFKAMPAWAWIIIAIVIIGSLMMESDPSYY